MAVGHEKAAFQPVFHTETRKFICNFLTQLPHDTSLFNCFI
nr:MAG TPA: hypothetical protein [Caudoviricetes sp.]